MLSFDEAGAVAARDELRVRREELSAAVETMTASVAAQTVGWADGSDSRQAQLAAGRRLEGRSLAVAVALGACWRSIDAIIEAAHVTESQNVAIIDQVPGEVLSMGDTNLEEKFPRWAAETGAEILGAFTGLPTEGVGDAILGELGL